MSRQFRWTRTDVFDYQYDVFCYIGFVVTIRLEYAPWFELRARTGIQTDGS